MRTLLLAAGMVAVLGGLAACADEGYGRRSGYVGADVAYEGSSPVGYDGFYDDYYGPFYDGYWGNDGGYYYSTGEGRGYQRDANHHFTHQSASGFHAVHGGRLRTGGQGDHGRL
jgi:hypothetical protein